MMKRIKSWTALFFVLTILFLLPATASAANEDYIKVGLKYGSTAVTQCRLTSSQGFQMINITESGVTETLPLPAYTELIASVQNRTIVLKTTDGTLVVSDFGDTGGIMPLHYADGNGTIGCNEIVYRDAIQLIANSNGTMNVVNYITMDHYLYGVLHAEMSQSYHIEALKAQAVVARSFANLNARAHANYGFDVCTTTHCQVYKGFANEYPKTNEAVDSTHGQLIHSGGKVVPAYYFKNSGGNTQNSEDVWSYKEDYLRGVKDPYSPDYLWNTTLTFDQIKTQLEKSNFSPGTIQSVAITARNSSGSVLELTIRGSSDTIVLKKEKVRTVLGATAIKSNQFSIHSQAGGGTSSGTTTSTNNNAGGGLFAAGGSGAQKVDGFYVMSADGAKKKTDWKSVYITNGGKAALMELGSSPEFSGETDERITGGVVFFSGKGYGHGVGMPQDSAIKMAEQGLTYDAILNFFFTNIEIY